MKAQIGILLIASLIIALFIWSKSSQSGNLALLVASAILLLVLAWRGRSILGPSVLMQLGKFEQAKQSYEKKIENNSGAKDWKLYLGLAQCQIQLAEPEAALAMCERAIELSPIQYICYLNRAVASFDCNKYQDALNDCQKALSLGCAEKFVYMLTAAAHFGMKNFHDAEKDCESLRTLSKGNELATVYILKSIIDSYQGRFEQAIEHCNEALKFNSRSMIAFNNRAHYLTALGELEKARADFRSAESLRHAPREAVNLLCGKSQLSFKEGDYQSALTYANDALNKRPTSPCALFVHALALAKTGDTQNALVELDRAIGIDAYSGECYWARHKVYEALAQSDKAEQDKQAYERLGYHPYL